MKFLIDFKFGVKQTEIDAYLQFNGCTVIKQFQNYDEVYLISCSAAPPVTDIIDTIVEDEINPIQLLSFDVSLDPTQQYGEIKVNNSNDWWKVASIKSPSFEAETDTYPIRGKGVTVYMMDSGLDVSHPEFVGADVRLVHSFTGEFSDVSGHGTALSSVIIGRNCGMTAATLAVVKIFEKGKATLQSDMLTAFDAVINDFEANGRRGSIVNMSWGINKNDYIEAKIRVLINRGVHVICAAGNSGIEIGAVTPACMSEVVTVGAYNQDFYPANFSNYTGSTVTTTNGETNGGELDGWAPGVDIYAAVPGNLYGIVAGTSIAAAIHTGATAYNMVNAMTSSGEVAPSNHDSTYATVYVSEIGFYRRYMMILEGKYAASANLVTTYKTRSTDVVLGTSSKFKVIVSTRFAVKIANSLAVSRITSAMPLPGNLVIDNGILIGSIDFIEGNAQNFKMEFNIILRDGGDIPYMVDVWVVQESYDSQAIAADPSADQSLKITPYVMDSGCDINTCASYGCVEGCRSCSGDPKNQNCLCFNQECV